MDMRLRNVPHLDHTETVHYIPLMHTLLEFTLAQDIENRQGIVGIKKPPLTRTASRGFRAARMEHTSP